MQKLLSPSINKTKEELYQRGFVHLNQVLSKTAIEICRDLLDDLFENHSCTAERYATSHASSLEKGNTEIHEINHTLKLNPELKKTQAYKQFRAIAGMFLGRRPYYSFDHAIYKPPHSGNIFWHQDQAYKNTVKQMQSIHMWIPLHDVKKNEGAMQYVPYSHKNTLLPHRRHNKTHTLFVDSSPDSYSSVVQCSAKLGDIIIHLPKTLHSSLPNTSEQVRKAWILHFSPYGRAEILLPQNLLYFLKNTEGQKVVIGQK